MPSVFDDLAAAVPADVWRSERREHIERVRSFTRDRVARASVAEPHAVYDFLFTYYSYRPSHLERWSPGADVLISDAPGAEIDWVDDTVLTPRGWMIPSSAFPQHRIGYLTWCIDYLTRIADRQPNFSCFGLHEWAMVYKSAEVRHSHVALRLSQAEIASVVEELGLRCTHYDAYRFFTPEAVPLNRDPLARETTAAFDQRACIHVTMDLYKFAYKISPWCPSSLIADAFLLAADARQVDMRASPYDLSQLGFEPLRIETISGRQDYLQEQRRLSELAAPIRTRLVEVYRALLEARVDVTSRLTAGD